MWIFIGLIIFVIIIIIFYKNNKNNKNDLGINFNVKMNSVSSSSKEVEEHFNELEKKYPKWYGDKSTKGICYKAERIEPLKDNKTEDVYYKTDRYADLFGRGNNHVSYFPGYGKIYNREFKIWYQDIGSKEKKEEYIYKDIGAEYPPPIFIEYRNESISIYNELTNNQGFIKLYNLRDQKNKRTWYAGLISLEFTGIITHKEKE